MLRQYSTDFCTVNVFFRCPFLLWKGRIKGHCSRPVVFSQQEERALPNALANGAAD
jgi:hypothetical protein